MKEEKTYAAAQRAQIKLYRIDYDRVSYENHAQNRAQNRAHWHTLIHISTHWYILVHIGTHRSFSA